MKKLSGMLKRTLASFLAVLMVMTAGNFGFVASVFAHDAGTDHVHVSLGELIVDTYGEDLSDAEEAIIKSGQLRADEDYWYVVPTEGDGLITVDEGEKVVTATVYEDDADNLWIPVSFDLKANGAVVTDHDDIALTKDGGVYTGNYTYGGNAFSVEVTYVLEKNVDAATQQAMLNAGSLLAKDIDKLLLLKANIIPEKPEGWDEMTEEEKKNHKDYDDVVANEALQKFVNDAMEQVTGKEANVTLTPETVLTFLVMPAIDYEDENGVVEKLSAIDLIGKLGAGITEGVAIPDELVSAVEDELNILEFNDGTGLYEVEIGFNNANNKVIARLIAQKAAAGNNGNLDLGKFLQNNKENSYLEWLMVGTIYETLVSALTGNYEDLKQLAEHTKALPGVRDSLIDLLADVKLIEGAAWDLITTTAAQYGQTITNKDELNTVLTPAGFDSVLASQMGELNAKLPELKQALIDAGYTAQAATIPAAITTKAQLETLLTTLEGVKGDAETKLNAALSVLKTELKNYGYPADLADAIDSTDDLTAVETWLNDRITTAQTNITTALAAARTIIDGTGCTVVIEDAADIDDAIAWLSTNASPEVKAAQQEVANKLTAAQNLAQTLGYPNYASIATSGDMDAVGTWLQDQITADQNTLQNYVDLANGYITEANEKLPDAEKYTGSITTSADIDAVITWMNQRIADAEADYATALSELNTQLTDKGYDGDEVTCAADIDNVVVPWINEKLPVLKQEYATACTEITEQLAAKGYSVTVNSSADLDSLASSIYSTINNNETVKSWYATFSLPYPVSTVAHVDAWITQLTAMNGILGDFSSQLTTLTNMKAALEVIESASAGLKQAEEAIATLEGDELTTLLENAEAGLAEAEALLKQANDNSGSLSSAKTTMANLEQEIKTAEDALPGQLTQLTTAKDNLKAAEDALLNVNDPYAAKINQLTVEKGKITSAQDQIAADEAEKISVADWKTTLSPAEEAFGQLNNAVTKMNDGLAAANGAYAKLEEVAAALDTVESTKTELNSTISMLEILITMLKLFCTTIEPVYDSCEANDWNVRSVLVDFDQDHYDANPAVYDDLTGWATGLTAPEIVIDDSLYIAETAVQFNMSMYDVTVVVKAEVIGQDNLPEALVDFSAGKVTLLKNATAAEIKAAIDPLNAEAMAKDFWEGVITDENYDVTYDVLPDTLTEDLTYVIRYTPKNLTVTYGTGFDGEHGLPTTVPYGYLLTLPEHDDPLKEWEYTVSGHDGKLREGSKITITAATEITRQEGAASTKYDLVDLVIETTPAMTATEKSILNSNALKLNDVIYVRMPNGEMITVDRVAGVTTVTAPNYDSNVAGDWKVFTGKVDGNPVTFTNGEYTTTSVFGEIIVSYQLSMTAAQLGLTGEQLKEYLNTPFILASDYKFQKETLDALVAALTLDGPDADNEAAPLEALEMLRRDFIVEKGEIKMALGNALGNLDTLAPVIGLELTPETRAAAAALLKVMPEDNSHVALYKTLTLYLSDDGGMEYYYKNEQAFIDQINELSSIMNSLTGDENLMKLLGSFKAQFDAINNALSAAASLGNPENRIRTDLIDVNSPALTNLLGDLAKYDQVNEYAAPDALKWVLDFTKAGPDKVSYTVNVNVLGTVKSATVVKGADEVFDPIAVRDQILSDNAMIPAGDELFIALTGSEVNGRVYTYTYGYKVFDSVSVEIGGQTVVVGTNMSMENTTITLPKHSNPAEFRYDYTVNGVAYDEGTSITLTVPQFKALINGTLVIDRTEVNLEQERLEKEEEEKRKQEQQLITDLGGLGVMTKIEEGKYALVLNLNLDDPMESLQGFVVGLLLNPYDTILLGSTELYGATVYGEGVDAVSMKQFHLQALVDLILNSGLTEDTLLGMIENGAFKNDFVLPGTYIELDGEGNPVAYGDLGTKFVQSTMTFQKEGKDDVVVDFYITLGGSGETVGTLEETLGKLPEAVGIELNGGLTVTADLPGVIYTAYLAALSMVGEVDLDNMDAATSEVVIGYVYDLLNPVLGNNAVTVTTIENTLALFDIEKDLSAYESYYNLIKRAYGVTPVYTDNGFKVILSDIDISSVIAQMQDMVDDMELPGGMKINLTNLIYEYNDPAYDDDEFGLDVVIGAGLGNIDAEYNVVYVDVKAEGLSNKFGMTTADKLALQATSVVVLVGNVEGDLVFNGTTTFVDLNGYTVSGNIVGNGGDVIVVDSDYTANGGANGVSGNVTVLGGKYAATLAEENLGKGYQQAADGTVGNRLFTVTETADTITVTLNATPEDVKSLLSQRGVIELAAEVLVDLVINHYNAAALSVDGNTIYNINFNDLLALATGTRDDLIDTALACISASDLADVFNAIVADLTNFEGMAAALAEGGDGIVSKHDFTTATWAMALGHDTEKDVLTLNLGASDEKTETKTLQLAIVGDARDDMAILTAALADTVTVESNLDLDDLVRANGKLAVNGSYEGSVIVDFAKNPGYVLAMTVILADGTTDAALKADLVNAIEAYAETGDMYAMPKVYNALSIKDICDALVNHIDEFDDMVAGLGLSAEAEAVIAANVTDNEMGYELLVDVVSYALFLLDSREIGESITGSGRTLGTFEKRDSKGLYYGFEKSGSIDKTVSVLDVTMDITNATVKVYLFTDHVCEDTDLDHKCDNGCDAYFGEHADGNFDHKCDYGCSDSIGAHVDANLDHACDYGCSEVIGDHTDANKDHACDYGCDLTIGDHTDANKDHVCDYGCSVTIGTCEDADKDHDCDYGCDKVYGEHVDANKDHACDYGCDLTIGDHTDANKDHVCDYGCSVTIGDHTDANKDHVCDYGCSVGFGTHEDLNKDHACDYGCSVTIGDHTDANKDHACDYGCSVAIGTCEDADKDHDCDYGCDKVYGEHVDANKDHACDYGCSVTIGDHTDANKDHACDYGCSEVIGDHTDANKDHVCDYGCDQTIGDHADANKDHVCDYGCSVTIGKCEDTDKDHACDYGCDKVYGKCEDADLDGYCDYGCGKKFPPVVGVPEIPVGDDVIGFKADADEGLLYLDTVQAGMSVADFTALLKAHVGTEYDADGCDVTVVGDANGLIATGTQVTITAKNLTGVDSVTYDVVVIGDTNCDGKVSSGDASLIYQHFCGVLSTPLNKYQLLAGDTNGNGRLESGDANKIFAKYVGVDYTTILEQEDQ